MRRTITLAAISLVLFGAAGMATTLQAASGYADPAFKAQWDQGEALAPNFWGPLSTAKDGQQEAYKEATGGMRLVQYFDKGRMELTNGKVTNGLLATEIVKGQMQGGDATFTGQAPPCIPIAGDPDGGGPTYATLATKASSLLAVAKNAPGSGVTATVGADGAVTQGAAGADPATKVGPFDDKTGHNVAAAFADYRTKAGLQTIGYAISEPFLAAVKVGGKPKNVMVQVFERRVLTYTADNPDPFKVEMGNIGQHYFRWRYPNGAAPAAPAAPAPGAAAAPSPTAPGVAGSKNPPAPTTSNSGPTFDVKLSDVVPTVKVGDIQTVNILTNGKTGCAIDIIYNGNIPAKSPGLQPKLTDDQGKATFSWAIGSEAKPGTAQIAVNCTTNNTLGTANASFTVSG